MGYQYGRRPPKNAPHLKLAPYLTGRWMSVPDCPTAADYLARLGAWQMLGNDTYGNCVAVTWANVRRLVSFVLTGKDVYPSQDGVDAVYRTQNPNFPDEDNGMDIQTLLEYLVKNGGPDGVKALGFAAVDYTNADEVKAAIAIFGSVWTGVNVLKVNMTQFDQGRPWDYSVASSVDGQHSVVSGGYGDTPADTGALSGDEKFITWAQETSFTDAFWSHQVEEAWVVLWPEMLNDPDFLAGIDLATFAADYTAITGKPFPAVVPPAPVTPPAPPVPPVPVTPPAPNVNPIVAELERVEKALVRAANEIAAAVKRITDC